ncbi:4-hydroxyphenylpyruvate dioxygenase [Corallococcus praedator]|uniref:4-hydroxyphenylpyruvate dioxygenase n=1 Tax=Corallococcus praedator TaxID=2316724 RepID=A0ABX9QC47_9BACT|nr:MULTISPECIES: 4-hydroxyphenylpyruvate dioxygenase [Corallococcus]RKH08758.1 4-hydroxyphenylpyruvate dioxygenase [Corallococcus sp. CA047B]RKH23964.1 4-hydroxyphenylpyruvate dioxygenase [Corallococcus sp. CA031C]RKH99960.1 4-hydroxyphenylpyruvate dioxygenase [Corallococcus praedator]
MAKQESLGIKALESIHWYVHDLERSRQFYTKGLDFAEVAVSGPELDAHGKQKSALFQAGEIALVVSQPVGEGGRAWRYLRKHPDGVGTLNFEVEDVEKTFKLLESRGATFITEIQRFTDAAGGKLAFFSITTPFGDTTFRFLQRDNYKSIYPGFQVHAQPKGGQNKYGFGRVDHVTSNFQTMKPMLLWMEHVMGFEPFWHIEFHTEDVASQQKRDHGSGLKSDVIWDPKSGVKFANNEPKFPFFKSSQINVFNEDHRGDGVQHLAITVKDILSSVKDMRHNAGIQFMPTPGSYYDALPERIEHLGIKKIDEDINVLRDLEILIDGDKERSYMLQIFMKDAASLYKQQDAGPFFYEIIQRKGDQGFGGGNFRALFESIERQQKAEGRI